MTDRPTVKPPRQSPSWTTVAMIAFGCIALCLSIAALGAQCQNNRAWGQGHQEPPIADPTIQTLILNDIHAKHLIGLRIDPSDPDGNRGRIRNQAGQMVCEWALLLHGTAGYEVCVTAACDVLADQWPWLDCPACYNLTP